MLKPTLAQDVLKFLGVRAAPPSRTALDALVAAYVRRIPWESASRIVRRAHTPNTSDCPRWPETFWREALALGTGGTCFESNYAFFNLLRFLGYEGYLTINNMRGSIGCHSAIVIHLPGEALPYLVDVGLPVHIPLPLDLRAQTSRHSTFHTYTATPDGEDYFLIERDRHPHPYCFTLVNTPVDAAQYRAVVTADYGKDGLFLDRVIVVRVVDEHIWRYGGDGVPYQLEQFAGEEKIYHYLGDDAHIAAERIAQKFGLDVNLLRAALAEVG